MLNKVIYFQATKDVHDQPLVQEDHAFVSLDFPQILAYPEFNLDGVIAGYYPNMELWEKKDYILTPILDAERLESLQINFRYSTGALWCTSMEGIVVPINEVVADPTKYLNL